MARQARPWYRKARKSWFVMIHGQQVNLGSDKKEALRLFHELKGSKQSPAATTAPFVETLAVEFVRWCAKHRAAKTAAWYKERIESFLAIFPDITSGELKPFHLDQWCDKHPQWSNGTKRGAMKAVQRCLSWAAKKGYIPYSPIANIQKPQGGKRDYLITQAEFERILANVPNERFRELLIVSWEIGCRPQESLIVEAHHVDLRNARWIFELKNSKGKKHQRVVYLTEKAADICQRLCLEHPAGPLFRMSSGEPWTPSSVNCQFVRLQHRLGKQVLREKEIVPDPKEIEAGVKALEGAWKKSKADLYCLVKLRLTCRLATCHAPKYCLCLLRHAWMTRLLQSGVDPITVATLAGHIDTSMLAKQYQHLAHDPEYLLAKARRAF